MSSTTSLVDLGYCQGARKEKAAMLESKFRPQLQSTPDLSSVKKSPSNKLGKVVGGPVRRTHSEDIKERVKLLEQAMSKSKYTRDLGGPPMDKSHPEYGKPQKGTWTAERGAKAHSHVHKEILELCEFIYMNGDETDDHMAVMLFGDLFHLYTRISDKVVGILLRARKYGLVHFEPEILFQGQDDTEPVYLTKPMQEIYLIYNTKKSFAHSASDATQDTST